MSWQQSVERRTGNWTRCSMWHTGLWSAHELLRVCQFALTFGTIRGPFCFDWCFSFPQPWHLLIQSTHSLTYFRGEGCLMVMSCEGTNPEEEKEELVLRWLQLSKHLLIDGIIFASKRLIRAACHSVRKKEKPHLLKKFLQVCKNSSVSHNKVLMSKKTRLSNYVLVLSHNAAVNKPSTASKILNKF